MTESGLQTEKLSNDTRSAVALICAHFSEGLHAMAQPLTVLRSAVITATAPMVSAADQKRYMQISADHVEGACQLFQSLQDLLFAWQNEADRKLIDLSELLASVCDVQGKVLRQSGMIFVLASPEALPPMLGDKDRTLQALFALLKITASVSTPGDSIELRVETTVRGFNLTLQNTRAQGRHLKSAARLSMALAEANIRSQQGDFRLVEDPFCISFTLPGGDAGSC